MSKLVRMLVLACVLLGFIGVVNADPVSLPLTIVVDGITYTQIVIDGEIYYTYDGVIYTYDSETGEVLQAEVSFPG
ncbi:MAG: hypothetical protein KAS73_12150 [Candidatus Sabulitectum sp.]|nr:hypothetical protein [Candidatus Sabulitectum sp.]